VQELGSVAVTVKEESPKSVGVPESSPALDSVSPGGSVPAVTAKVQVPGSEALSCWL
jgi:hypothetical protein